MYPKMIIDMKKLESNVDAVAKITKEDGGCSMMLVTKALCADRNVCKMLAEHPQVDFLADSRIANIKKYYDHGGCNGKRVCFLRCLYERDSGSCEVRRYQPNSEM